MEKGGMHRSVHAQLDQTWESCVTLTERPEPRKRGVGTGAFWDAETRRRKDAKTQGSRGTTTDDFASLRLSVLASPRLRRGNALASTPPPRTPPAPAASARGPAAGPR